MPNQMLTVEEFKRSIAKILKKTKPIKFHSHAFVLSWPKLGRNEKSVN